MSCRNPSYLQTDLIRLGSALVSVVAVLDPLDGQESAMYLDAFPDLLRPFKQHYLVNLDGDFVGVRPGKHRRNVKQARKKVRVEIASRPSEHHAEWVALYRQLIAYRNATSSSADFTEAGLQAQLDLPGMRYYRAMVEDTCVAASLWLDRGDHTVYHLSASNETGHRLMASYALVDAALEDAAMRGLGFANLGGAAGLEDDESDGLAQFKLGWSNERATALIGGKILDHAAYEEICGPTETGSAFFPAYRSGGRK